MCLSSKSHGQSGRRSGRTAFDVFLARLPALVEAATAHMPDWQILVLSPVNTPYDFYAGKPPLLTPPLLKPSS